MTLALSDIVTYWAGRQHRGPDGIWSHEDDRAALSSAENLGFNLRYPVSPYIGRILEAPVVILNLNGGYDSALTPREFTPSGAADAWLARVADPDQADWSGIPSYYHSANYGPELLSGRAVAINACAYRSPNLQRGPARSLADRLPSVRFHRRWLTEALLPLATSGKRLIIAHRWGLWKIPPSAEVRDNLLYDLRCRAFPDIDTNLLIQARAFSKELR